MTKEELLDGLGTIESRIDTLWYEVEQCDEILPINGVGYMMRGIVFRGY